MGRSPEKHAAWKPSPSRPTGSNSMAFLGVCIYIYIVSVYNMIYLLWSIYIYVCLVLNIVPIVCCCCCCCLADHAISLAPEKKSTKKVQDSEQLGALKTRDRDCMYLVGGLGHDFYDFLYIGNFIIPTDELIFFRGVGMPPTSFVGFFVSLFFSVVCSVNHVAQ